MALGGRRGISKLSAMFLCFCYLFYFGNVSDPTSCQVPHLCLLSSRAGSVMSCKLRTLRNFSDYLSASGEM